MQILNAKFVKSSPNHTLCPEGNLPEYAFIGRSNVGKSSLINALVDRKNLAKTSNTPGKTQLINHFIINDEWHLVDLPGYGFAKISKKTRAAWEKMIYNYLTHREQLVNTFILIDSRHAPLEIDLDLIAWFGKKQRPFSLIFTKTDKLSKSKLAHNLKAYREELNNMWDEIPLSIITSAKSKRGREDLLSFIEEMNNSFKITPE
ncbi:MAG: ribosome biogenesis GTP-binding protein YihA/YsxC [Bacteroidales bacterium]|nr:ribosome biogenesis GTP-binding protein YihA/YsxC [Bacteroidales bacterium]MCF8404467.1 ribosome biogenesis GTP-binding protein YihA/YsxC [Bacteroidales bacterium]